jgi:Ricin-type beta-trefoil lectin domain/delta endotoxin, N-terminal domain
MRMMRRRVWLGGLVALGLAVSGLFGVLAASSSATRPVAKPTAQLGAVTALAWGVQAPVGAQLVLQPYVTFNLRQGALRVLRATEPRLSGVFAVRIMTAPLRGRSRTVAVVSRHVSGVAVRAAAVNRILGSQLQLRRWMLTRKQTRAVKRAAARGRLELTFSARYRISYTGARGRTLVTPSRSGSGVLPFALTPQQARGGNLRNVASTFRHLLGQVAQLKTACVTRNAILEELRNTYGVMVSGDRTGAAGLLQTYARYTDVRRAGGLLTRAQASMLASGLGGLLKRVGSGRSKRVERAPRWPALPDCGPIRAHASQTIVTIIVLRVAERWLIGKIIRFPFKRARKRITREMRQAKDTEYPEDTSQPGISNEVPSGDPTHAQATLDDIQTQMDAYDNWASCCLETQPGQSLSAWNGLMNTFAQNRWRFEPSTSYYTLNDEVELLPAFAQYINMYLTALQEGVEYGPDWGLTPDTILSLENKIRAELNPNGPTSGCTGATCPGGDAMSYSKRVYDAGLAQLGSSTDPQTNFNKTNEYKREMQIGVLDMRDQWHVSDPMDYPYGDPSYRRDRMIYSDAVGSTTHTFAAPANVANPLNALTAWTAPYSNRNWLAAIKADNSPQAGTRTGTASGGTEVTYNGIAPDSTPGPIAQVDATSDASGSKSQQVIRGVEFHFSNGSTAVPGGATPDTTYGSNFSFSYDGEVLATAKVMGSYAASSSTALGDAMVFGFRSADSFSPSWHGSLPGPRRAPNTQACLGVEQVTLASGGTTGSRAEGAAAQMRNCSSAQWDQTWQYIDYNDPSDPDSAAAQHELTVYAGRMCMAPKTGANGNWVTGGGGPTTSTTSPPPPHTLVAVYDCNESAAQKWTMNSDGTIRPENAGDLCLARQNGSTASGTAIQLDTCSAGDAAQRWSRS